MSSVGGSVQCAGCRKLFKRLSSHISLSPICEQHYTSLGKIEISIAPKRSARVGGLSLHDSPGVRQEYGSSLPTTRTTDNSTINCEERPTPPTIGDNLGLVNDDLADVFSGDDEDDFQVLDDNASCNEAARNHVDDDGAPDRCVLDLYKEMLELRANPLGLDRISVEEKVHIELLHMIWRVFDCVS